MSERNDVFGVMNEQEARRKWHIWGSKHCVAFCVFVCVDEMGCATFIVLWHDVKLRMRGIFDFERVGHKRLNKFRVVLATQHEVQMQIQFMVYSAGVDDAVVCVCVVTFSLSFRLSLGGISQPLMPTEREKAEPKCLHEEMPRFQGQRVGLFRPRGPPLSTSQFTFHASAYLHG